MSTKHYTPNYLEETGRFLKELKQHSYQPFLNLHEGTVLDLGCGTGIDVIRLAELAGGKVKVVGIDHDAEMLARAKAAAGENTAVEFILSEASPIPFHDQSLNGVRAERLIQHLVDPEGVIAEMHRVLKSDSPLVIVETDWAGLTFYNEHHAIEQEIVRYLTDIKINNGLAARKLPVYLEKAGFKEIRLEVFPFVIRTLPEAKEYLWIDRIVQEADEKGIISREEYETFMTALTDAQAKNYFACSINVIVASCIK